MKNIAAAFVKAQKGFAPALKTNTNPHFRSKYVALDGCIEAVIDALNANGIALMQPTHQDDTGVTVETLFIHESGETLSGGKLHVPAAKQDAQGYGSALTYARRYSLMAACGIAPEDDDGNAASRRETKAVTQEPKTLTQAQVSEISALLDGRDFEAFMVWVSKCTGRELKALNEVPAEAYKPIIKRLTNKEHA
jgi:hypothetical protein